MDTFIKKINKVFDSSGEDDEDIEMPEELSHIFEKVLSFVGGLDNDNIDENEEERLLNIYNDLVIQYVMYYNDNTLLSTVMALLKPLKDRYVVVIPSLLYEVPIGPLPNPPILYPVAVGPVPNPNPAPAVVAQVVAQENQVQQASNNNNQQQDIVIQQAQPEGQALAPNNNNNNGRPRREAAVAADIMIRGLFDDRGKENGGLDTNEFVNIMEEGFGSDNENNGNGNENQNQQQGLLFDNPIGPVFNELVFLRNERERLKNENERLKENMNLVNIEKERLNNNYLTLKNKFDKKEREYNDIYLKYQSLQNENEMNDNNGNLFTDLTSQINILKEENKRNMLKFGEMLDGRDEMIERLKKEKVLLQQSLDNINNSGIGEPERKRRRLLLNNNNNNTNEESRLQMELTFVKNELNDLKDKWIINIPMGIGLQLLEERKIKDIQSILRRINEYHGRLGDFITSINNILKDININGTSLFYLLQKLSQGQAFNGSIIKSLKNIIISNQGGIGSNNSTIDSGTSIMDSMGFGSEEKGESETVDLMDIEEREKEKN